MSKQNDTTKHVVFRHSYYRDDRIWIYRNGYLSESITIDPTYDALEWCQRKGMNEREVVTADNGVRYAIYNSPDLICAIPLREVTA